VSWREARVTGSALLGTRMPSLGGALAPQLLVSTQVEGQLAVPVMVANDTASLVYWDSNFGELRETTVRLSDGTMTAARGVSLGGYKGASAAATLPTGDQLIASAVTQLNGDVELVAVDVGPLRVLDAGAVSAVRADRRRRGVERGVVRRRGIRGGRAVAPPDRVQGRSERARRRARRALGGPVVHVHSGDGRGERPGHGARVERLQRLVLHAAR